MDQFKLKSIDELDLEFVAKTRGQSPVAPPTPNSVNQQNSVDFDFGIYSNPTQSLDAEPTYSPQPENKVKKPRPLVPIGQNNTGYSPVGAPVQQEEPQYAPENQNYYNETVPQDAPKKKAKNKNKSTGALVGKIVAIVLLVATVIVFLLGCFVSVFLDNGGSNIGGICFNTMSEDPVANSESSVSKGDLIISKKGEISEYEVGDLIAVPSATLSGCDIHKIIAINPVGFDMVEFVTIDQNQMQCTIMESDCYGEATVYLPIAGGLLSFAIENAVLVCILFVLLAAFWCLLLVLLEKSGGEKQSSTKAKAPKAPKAPKPPKAPKAPKTK